MPATEALAIRFQRETGQVRLVGAATIHTAEKLSTALADLPEHGTLEVDLSALDRIDTAGAQVLIAAETRVESAGGHVDLIPGSAQTAGLLKRVRRSQVPVDNFIHRLTYYDIMENLGRSVVEGSKSLAEWFGVFGVFLSRLSHAAIRPREFRLTSLVHHIQEVGLKAVPIVALMAFLIGVVLAFQGSTQLRQFGAEVFVVDLIAISILRELGVLLTAIIVGRPHGIGLHGRYWVDENA